MWVVVSIVGFLAILEGWLWGIAVCQVHNKQVSLLCTMFTNGLVCIQDASEALFFRSAFKNVIFNATEGVKESQSVSLNKSLDPEGIIYMKNQLSEQDQSVKSANI